MFPNVLYNLCAGFFFEDWATRDLEITINDVANVYSGLATAGGGISKGFFEMIHF